MVFEMNDELILPPRDCFLANLHALYHVIRDNNEVLAILMLWSSNIHYLNFVSWFLRKNDAVLGIQRLFFCNICDFISCL